MANEGEGDNLGEKREELHTDVEVKRERKALIKFKNGIEYEGEWMGNLRDGWGRQKWPDGAIYEGQWENNKAEGKGKFTHTNGDYY